MFEAKNLLFGKDSGIGVVTINRPDALNALNRETLLDLKIAFQSLADDPDTGVVILTGAGEKAFVAGADIKELADLDPLTARHFSREGQAIFDQIEDFPKPVIAAVNGYCLGGGCELAMACHMRIASEQAVFGQPEVKLGLIPGFGGTQRLPRLVGPATALEMVLSGDMIDAQEAFRIGLVNRVVPLADLLPTARTLALRILKNAPLAVRFALGAVHEGCQMPLAGGLAHEADLFGLSCTTEDMREGTRAFVGKRKPRFLGK